MFHSSESNFTGRAVPGWWSRRSSHGVSGQRYSGKKDLPRDFLRQPYRSKASPNREPNFKMSNVSSSFLAFSSDNSKQVPLLY
jgi:hypothetical protein